MATAICDVCGRAAEIIVSCWKCGARLCARCTTPTGLCIRCAGELRMPTGDVKLPRGGRRPKAVRA